MQPIPCLPESAPFTPEQRAYLNGFLAGLFSRTTIEAPTVALTRNVGAKPLLPLTVLFGSQTGTAEGLAKRLAKEAGKHGFAPTTFDLAQYPRDHLKTERHLLLITSTYGEGDPPDNAKAFWEFLSSDLAPALPQLKFSVLALGDSNYEKFCACGKNFDARFEALGAGRIYPRVECDVECEEPFQKWMRGVLRELSASGIPAVNLLSPPALIGEEQNKDRSVSAPIFFFNRQHPFPATVRVNRKLNGPNSAKDTRHLEIALGNAGLSYEAGDALGVWPANCPELVAEIISTLGCDGDEPIAGQDGREISLRSALWRHYEITKIPQAFLQAVAEKSRDAALIRLCRPGVNGELAQFLWGREIIDLLLKFPKARFSAVEFVDLLKKLQPRLYSIASSPKAHEGQAHLTVGVVRYQAHGRARKGVCSTFLADRAPGDTPVPVFVHQNKAFRPPADPAKPVIMVGPGTGIAPYRAFLEERRAIGASGRSWLFFGDQHAATDFLYQDELQAMLREGTLTQLDAAFSRDQEQKVYVQHRMAARAKELYDWLEEGAHFYVCGDARRMAKDVEQALRLAIEVGGGRTPEASAQYVQRLKEEKRYQRDVY